MKKTAFTFLAALLALTATAQEKGRFEVYDFGNFRLHVYYSNDVMADASFIIEGEETLATMEPPLFKDNVAEFDAYLTELAKPVETRICDYHIGGTGDEELTMPEGMPEFTKGDIYGGMMQGFAQAFGDSMADMPDGNTSEVAFGTTETWAGVPFEFRHGAASDFPGASILIGDKVYYTHWTPAKAHMSHLQISSPAAIDAEIEEAENSLSTDAELFIGGHGGAAGRDAVEFKISYLKKMKELLDENQTADAFVEAMQAAFPDLPGAEGLPELGAALYR